MNESITGNPAHDTGGAAAAARLAMAVDAIAGAGFEADRLPAGCGGDARRLLGLLTLLERSQSASPGASTLLIDVTMSRIAARGRADGVAARVVGVRGVDSPLSCRCGEAVDELVESRWDPAVAGDAGRRLRPLAHLLALAEASEGGAGRSLVDSTLARIAAASASQSDRMRFTPVQPVQMTGRGGRFRVADLAAVAAMVVIGGAILWPMLVSMRTSGVEAGCMANMHSAGFGFASYAAAHDGLLPAARPDGGREGRDGAPWWGVGDEDGDGHSHSANLFTLAREGYARVETLACPGNPGAPVNIEQDRVAAMHDWASSDAVSFSFQLFGDVVPRLSDPGLRVLMTDRSPAVARAMAGEAVDPHANSANHAGHGQHVLGRDGSVVFVTSPLLGGEDNMWLPRSAERDGAPRLRGTELPASGDVFVGP